MADKPTYDRDKVKELRMKLIEASFDILNEDPKVKKWSAYKREFIMKMSSRILPVLNEHSGQDGNPINITISKEIAQQNGISTV